MEPIMESMKEKLKNIHGCHDDAQAKLYEHESQVTELRFECDCRSRAEESIRKQAGRAEASLKNEVMALRGEKQRKTEFVEASHARVVTELEDRLRLSEHALVETATKAEVGEKQRLWEASAYERQSAAHASERRNLSGDVEEAQQLRRQVERRADGLQEQVRRLQAEMSAALAEGRERGTKADMELSASESRHQNAERKLYQVSEEEKRCETRVSGVERDFVRVKEELAQERVRATDALESERRQSEGERRNLDRQARAIQARAQQEEQHAVELLRSQEALHQRWKVELSYDRDALETSIERLTRENQTMRQRCHAVLKLLSMRRVAGDDQLVAALAAGFQTTQLGHVPVVEDVGGGGCG